MTEAAEVIEWVQGVDERLAEAVRRAESAEAALAQYTEALQIATARLSDVAGFIVGKDKPTPNVNIGAGVIRPLKTDEVVKPGIETFGKWNSDGVLQCNQELRDHPIAGYVQVLKGGLVENCEGYGDPKLPAAKKWYPLVQVAHTPPEGRQVPIRWNTLHSSYPTTTLNGIGGHDYFAEHNYLHHLVDGYSFNTSGTDAARTDLNVDIQASWEGMRLFMLDPGHDPTPQKSASGVDVGQWGGKGWTHSDGAQEEKPQWKGVRSRGNVWGGYWADPADLGTTSPLPLAVKQISAFMWKGYMESRDDWFGDPDWHPRPGPGFEYMVNSTVTASGFVDRGKFDVQAAMVHTSGKRLGVVNNKGAVKVTNSYWSDGQPVVVAF